MERIYYAGTSFLVDDDVATALVAYVERLIKSRSSGAVSLPAGYLDGSVGRLDLLLSPTSVIGFEPQGGHDPRLRDDVTVDRMRMRTDELGGRLVMQQHSRRR